LARPDCVEDLRQGEKGEGTGAGGGAAGWCGEDNGVRGACDQGGLLWLAKW
jgi:hypothetical protein